jgi:hypothetical protein
MSKETTTHKVESRVVLSSVYPRVAVWSPISLQDAVEQMVALDASNVTVYRGDIDSFEVPSISQHLITAVCSDVLISGFSGRRNQYQLQGAEEASFVLFKGSLLVPKYDKPAEMRFALLQTKLSQESLDELVNKEQARLYENRNKRPVSRFLTAS